MINGVEFDGMELMETIQASFDHIRRENRMGKASADPACGAARLRNRLSYTIVSVIKQPIDRSLAPVRQGILSQMSIDSFMVRNFTQNKKNFPLELHAKTFYNVAILKLLLEIGEQNEHLCWKFIK